MAGREGMGQTRRAGARRSAVASSRQPSRASGRTASTPVTGRRASAPRSPRSTKGALLARSRAQGVLAAGGLLAIAFVIGLLWFARPATSELEKRTLTEFPAATPESIMDGSFFSEVALWYSDTYPLREWLVGLNQGLGSLHGIQTGTQMVGGNIEADELPPEGESAQGEGDATVTPEVEGPVEVPEERLMQGEIQNQIMSGLYVENGAAYSIYYFSKSSVERYAQAISTAAQRLDGHARVFSILVPNNSGALLDEATLESLGGTDQAEAIRYFYSLYDERVYPVRVMETLRAHNDEYIYFRSDHHWTQLGAYYAYLEYCDAAGIEAANVMSWQKMRFEPFLGSFYTELGNAEMAANPDYVDAWVPPSTNDLVYWDRDGVQQQGNVILDTTAWDRSAKNLCFIGGDWPLIRIDNPNLSDGSACLVVKESYGDPFAALLVENYQTVWVIDFRYSEADICDFVVDNGIADVIFMNNITLAGTDPVSQALLAEVS